MKTDKQDIDFNKLFTEININSNEQEKKQYLEMKDIFPRYDQLLEIEKIYKRKTITEEDI